MTLAISGVMIRIPQRSKGIHSSFLISYLLIAILSKLFINAVEYFLYCFLVELKLNDNIFPSKEVIYILLCMSALLDAAVLLNSKCTHIVPLTFIISLFFQTRFGISLGKVCSRDDLSSISCASLRFSGEKTIEIETSKFSFPYALLGGLARGNFNNICSRESSLKPFGVSNLTFPSLREMGSA